VERKSVKPLKKNEIRRRKRSRMEIMELYSLSETKSCHQCRQWLVVEHLFMARNPGVNDQRASVMISPTIPEDKAASSEAQPEAPDTGPIIDSIIDTLKNLVDNLPDCVPEASESDRLAVFGGSPEEFDNPILDADELWETTLNHILKSALGWGMEGNMNEIIRRGRWGLDGLVNFAKYFVEKRG
jgi:hypothetical protein